MRGTTGVKSGCLRVGLSLKWIRAGLASGLVVASLAVPGVALGASSSVAAYSRPGGGEQADVASRNASNARPDGGVLPFTGLDLWWLVGGGALLTGMGVLLAALARGGEVSTARVPARDRAGISGVREPEAEPHYSLR